MGNGGGQVPAYAEEKQAFDDREEEKRGVVSDPETDSEVEDERNAKRIRERWKNVVANKNSPRVLNMLKAFSKNINRKRNRLGKEVPQYVKDTTKQLFLEQWNSNVWWPD